MSRKNYEEVAKILAWYRMETPTDLWVSLVADFAVMFAKDNPNFDIARFRLACQTYETRFLGNDDDV